MSWKRDIEWKCTNKGHTRYGYYCWITSNVSKLESDSLKQEIEITYEDGSKLWLPIWRFVRDHRTASLEKERPLTNVEELKRRAQEGLAETLKGQERYKQDILAFAEEQMKVELLPWQRVVLQAYQEGYTAHADGHRGGKQLIVEVLGRYEREVLLTDIEEITIRHSAISSKLTVNNKETDPYSDELVLPTQKLSDFKIGMMVTYLGHEFIVVQREYGFTKTEVVAVRYDKWLEQTPHTYL